MSQLRTIFLREFTRNLIVNSKPREFILSHHPVKPKLIPVEEVLELVRIGERKGVRDIEAEALRLMESEAQKKRDAENNRRRAEQITRLSQVTRPMVERRAMPQPIRPQVLQMAQPANPMTASITPEPEPLPQGFSLGRLDVLASDRSVTSIDCAGPGKVVVVKSSGRVLPTQIILSEEEVKNVVYTFSEFSKIPVFPGVFKAAVGNLVMTAVISDLVGSRFIINKYTPYSILEGRL